MSDKLLPDSYENTALYGSLKSPQVRLLIGVPMTGLIRCEWMIARYHQIIPINWNHGDRLAHIPNVSPVNYLVAEARNSIVKFFLEKEYEWLFFIDHDTIIPADCFMRINEYMSSGDVPLMSGLYFTRSVPSAPIVNRKHGDGYFKDWKLGDKIWVRGVPMGCTLIHRSILQALWDESEEYYYRHQAEKLRRVFESPSQVYFDPDTLEQVNDSGTEDFSLCRRIVEDKIFEKAGWPEYQEKEFPFLIDTGIFCKHIDWDGTQYPSQGEEFPFAVCKFKNCDDQAVAVYKDFYWCERHLPEWAKKNRDRDFKILDEQEKEITEIEE